jgi:hypothetical protein
MLGRGELVRLLYRLGRHAASGVLTLNARAVHADHRDRPAHPSGRPPPCEPSGPYDRSEFLVLRRGAAVCGAGDLARRALMTRLACVAAEGSVAARFDSGISAYPPGALHQLPLAGWARSHLEAQLDGVLAEVLVRELTGVRLTLRAELAPEPLDEVDRRMLTAMAVPRSLDQIWPLARTPRFRLLGFLHFLRAVDALEVERSAPERSSGHPQTRGLDSRRRAALQLLGLDDTADTDGIKRAYRRLARTLHPDLQPEIDAARRRALERRFAELTAAYDALT